MQRIYEVVSAQVSFAKSNPVQIIVYAEGTVPTSGWKNPSLGAWLYISPPDDGIQDFDFVAEAPTGIVLPKISPIAAQNTVAVDPDNYWGHGLPLRGVRIHARNGAFDAFPIEVASESSVPWPWAW
ncbi:hypothetical protein ACQQ2Q_22340 [Agrobacterium sp. ES01]|uniref:hypothetical protein n=1 Tax=Agrobacterium sp. ES01 TaxID=3420714 RepID=UPI003D0C4F3A